jgi:hypothetical protein
MRFFWLPLSTMKRSGVPFTHICEWKRGSSSFGSSGSPGWSLVVAMVALGSTSMIRLPLSDSGRSLNPHLILRLSLRPSSTALRGQQCYVKGSYGSHTTSQYLSLSFWCPSLLAAWTGVDYFPDQLHRLLDGTPQTTQQPILKMEIIDNYICTQHLVGGGKVRVCLIELGPSRGLMATGV